MSWKDNYWEKDSVYLREKFNDVVKPLRKSGSCIMSKKWKEMKRKPKNIESILSFDDVEYFRKKDNLDIIYAFFPKEKSWFKLTKR